MSDPRNCGIETETTRYIPYECEALVTRRRLINFIEEPYFKAANIQDLLQFWRRVYTYSLELRSIQREFDSR